MIIQGKAWGMTAPLFCRNNVEIHLFNVKKGGFCSKHLHKHKYNQFIIIGGKLEITQWKDYGLEDVTVLEQGQELIVPPGEYHRFRALEDVTGLEIYWVDLNQNDIMREDCGGSGDEEKADICDAKPDAGGRKAVFLDRADYAADELYGKKYFGND